MGDRQLKAAQIVVPGDRLRVRQPGFERILEVQYVISKRVGPEAAARCFIDHTPPRPKEYIPQIPVRDRGTGRPTKKDRREMERLRDGFPSGPQA